MFVLLNSPVIVVDSATVFLVDPPSINPTLKVVFLSNLPCGNLVIKSAAILIADNPFSGSAPACADRPVISIMNPIYVGLDIVIVLAGPSPSNTIASLAEINEKSKFSAPTNPISSSLVKTTSTGGI